MTSENREAKLLRLRDITLYHLQNANPQIGSDKIDALEHDIIVWVKNFLLTCQELSVTADVHQIGDNDNTTEAICTGGQ